MTGLITYFVVFRSWTRNPSKSSKVSKGSDFNLVSNENLTKYYYLAQGWGTCGPRVKCSLRKHLMWPTLEFLLPKFEYWYDIMSKQSSIISRYFDSKTREVTLSHGQIKVEFRINWLILQPACDNAQFMWPQVCTFHDRRKQGIDQQIFNRKLISRKITHPQSLFK